MQKTLPASTLRQSRYRHEGRPSAAPTKGAGAFGARPLCAFMFVFTLPECRGRKGFLHLLVYFTIIPGPRVSRARGLVPICRARVSRQEVFRVFFLYFSCIFVKPCLCTCFVFFPYFLASGIYSAWLLKSISILAFWNYPGSRPLDPLCANAPCPKGEGT